MPAVTIGSNRFEGVAFPLILDDRFFLLEEQDGKDKWTVFTFQAGKPIIEVLRNEPKNNPLSIVQTNATGIITVTDPQSGRFLYKIRPGSKRSSIFGMIGDTVTEVEVLDTIIRVGTNEFRHNTFKGVPVGITVRGGRTLLGASLPAELLRLLVEST